MFRFNNSVGQTGGDSSSFPSPRRRGRVRSADFGMPERQGLIDLARPTGNPSMAATVTAPVMSAAACDTTLAHLRSLGLVRLDDAEAAALTAALDSWCSTPTGSRQPRRRFCSRCGE